MLLATDIVWSGLKIQHFLTEAAGYGTTTADSGDMCVPCSLITHTRAMNMWWNVKAAVTVCTATHRAGTGSVVLTLEPTSDPTQIPLIQRFYPIGPRRRRIEYYDPTDVSGHCRIVFGQARTTVMRATRNGVSPTTNYVTVEKSRQCHTSSTLVHWPSLTAVYCAYMKQMTLPSTGWQHMALSTR